ncbi:hypothetical protein Dred_0106 [Desulforamulus reducens MI-1]|uniref:Uncharacterized protein n=2 Tax=Desulforamulus TaxID=2916693 RepID=A4J0Q3_DESRM|nr:hypothetical protein Dred_0106 [Desulforamulus reducens MI-1]
MNKGKDSAKNHKIGYSTGKTRKKGELSMMFTQRTPSTYPMTKDVMARRMENPNYMLERINEVKKSPKQKPVLEIILEKYPFK